MVFRTELSSNTRLDVDFEEEHHRAVSDQIRVAINDITAQAMHQNSQVLGHAVNRPIIFVDGVEKHGNLRADDVQDDSVIEIVFGDLVNDEFVNWISAQLDRHSPVGGPPEPTYAKSHIILVDRKAMRVGEPIPPDAREFVFVNTVPYARKLERGMSPQAPHGVYQVVAALARQRFANEQMTIHYEFYQSNPAIVVRLTQRKLSKI